MTTFITPGSAIGCTINSHRSGWDGNICKSAESWNCSTTQEFRSEYCQAGEPRCYHLNIFNENNPYFLSDDKGIGWLLEPYPDALNDQILLFWGKAFQEPRGISELTGRQQDYVFGGYRVKRVEAQRVGDYRTIWRIEPYPDSWVRFQKTHLFKVYYRSIASGYYLKEVYRTNVEYLFEKVSERVRENPQHGWHDPRDLERFHHFHAQIVSWLEASQDTTISIQEKMEHRRALVIGSRSPTVHKSITIPSIETSNKDSNGRRNPSVLTGGVSPAAESHKLLSSRPYPLIEKESIREKIRDLYGKETSDAIIAVSLTKNILILTGTPGTGKSSLAADLIDDHERRLIVPVGSTWRGREDLLGYVNPISNEFEPTDFTKFLYHTEQKWRQDDKRTRLVIFEEFNLSQPEYWFSDILVRSQYPDDQESLRTIELGGKAIRGLTQEGSRMMVTPNLRFVATINHDHTTLSLSPRVLDRAAIIELSIEPRGVLERLKINLEEKQIMAIEDLHVILRYKNGTFSIRAGESLHRCLENLSLLESNDTWEAIDIILVQQVLSKVRLMVGDPTNESLIQSLEEWSEGYGKYLRRCAGLVINWSDALKAGRDVILA